MENNYTDRKYMIFSVSELPLINFSEVIETSIETIRKTKSNTKTFVKWESENIPASVNSLTTKEGPYTHSEMLIILKEPDWSEPIVII